MDLQKRDDETLTEYTIRLVRAEAWDLGYRSGCSNTARRFTDEPNAPTTANPYVSEG